MQGINHQWSSQDVLLSYALYRLRISPKERQLKFNRVLEHTEIQPQSMKLAFQNFEYLDGIGNYGNCSKAAIRAHQEHQSTAPHALVELIDNESIRDILRGSLRN